MELGEALVEIERRITENAEAEFGKSGLPLTMQPIVMRCVSNRFLEKAYSYKIEGKKRAEGGNAGDERSEKRG